MTLLHILIFCAASLVCFALLRQRGRAWFILLGSILALYWLQSGSPIRNLGFWLPTATLLLAALCWAITRKKDETDMRQTLRTLGVIGGLVLLIAVLRYLGPLCCLTTSRPPQLPSVLLALLICASLVALGLTILSGRSWASIFMFGVILLLFVVLKSVPLSEGASALLRRLTGQSPELASAFDLSWLGFSYIAFRLLHTLRDWQTGRLPALSLREYISYVVFFPTITAGPIERAERFAQSLRRNDALRAGQVLEGGQRIVLGIFKKFVLADSLALIALNAGNAVQSSAGIWTWALLYAYSFQIFLDFSGYTDIAIGIGMFCGIKVPENFARPYLKQNITLFWNSWHITLAQWFRSYFFNPLTRALRSARKPAPVALIIFTGQLSTMALIGLWHGITWNFLIWGAWHGLGLFVHNRWSEWVRPRLAARQLPEWVDRLGQAGGVLLTFHFVTLGWVWFSLPTPALAVQVFGKLLGM
jgi:alginate O-acetyltransferase complex protein AlgI